MERTADSGGPRASLLAPGDDVATALHALRAGTALRLAAGSVVRDVTLQEDVPFGHKFAVRALAQGMRVRKYGEFIGRTTADVAAGAWVHDQNLVTSARPSADRERAWRDAAPPADLRALGPSRTTVGECPIYDAKCGRLWWIDVRETPAIHALDLATGGEQRWPMKEDIGALVSASDGRLLAGLRSGFAWVEPETCKLLPIADPEPDAPQRRLNEGKCDAAGRLWCGSMNPESAIAEGNVYVLDHTLRWRRVDGGWLTPNGFTWSRDGRTMYSADTRRGLVYAADYDVATGTAGARRVFADLGAFPGGPDGATVDADGFLWWAQFEGGCLIRFAPGGAIDRVVRLPVSRPTSCTFGGAGYRRLFVTTATRGLDAARLAAEPLAGRVLELDVGVAGMPAVPFAVGR